MAVGDKRGSEVDPPPARRPMRLAEKLLHRAGKGGAGGDVPSGASVGASGPGESGKVGPAGGSSRGLRRPGRARPVPFVGPSALQPFSAASNSRHSPGLMPESAWVTVSPPSIRRRQVMAEAENCTLPSRYSSNAS